MKVLVSGASGLVGSALVKNLRRAGDEVRCLSRNGKDGILWEPGSGALDRKVLQQWDGPEAVVHLAGESIAARRWSAEQKRRIRESRVAATEKLCQTLSELSKPPSVFIGASAVGLYGSRGDEVLSEQSQPGSDFLSEVVLAWERASAPLASARVVHLRFGMILARGGGALPKIVTLFRLGLGGRLGSGRQWMSWIALEDAISAIEFCLRNPVSGAFNTMAPNPVTNAEFTHLLAEAVHRPAILPAPRFGLRLILGEMADALLLSSQRAIPQRLLEGGFIFKQPTLREALREILS